MRRIVLLSRLREGVDAASYEKWVVERDYPFARALPSIDRYEVSRVDGYLFGTEGKADSHYDYVEVIDVSDLDRYHQDLGTDEAAKLFKELSTYIEDFVAVQGGMLE